MAETTVVNIHKTKDFDVYIGRGSVYGNPFMIGERNRRRPAVIRLYRARFLRLVEADAEFRGRVEGLRGKRLGCFCKPLACHGDVIVEYLEGKKE